MVGGWYLSSLIMGGNIKNQYQVSANKRRCASRHTFFYLLCIGHHNDEFVILGLITRILPFCLLLVWQVLAILGLEGIDEDLRNRTQVMAVSHVCSSLWVK